MKQITKDVKLIYQPSSTDCDIIEMSISLIQLHCFYKSYHDPCFDLLSILSYWYNSEIWFSLQHKYLFSACETLQWSSEFTLNIGSGQQRAWVAHGAPLCLCFNIFKVILRWILKSWALHYSYSLIYFAEKESSAQWSFPDSFWWGLMVLTTVGYGERAPDTPVGQVSKGRVHLLSLFPDCMMLHPPPDWRIKI